MMRIPPRPPSTNPGPSTRPWLAVWLAALLLAWPLAGCQDQAGSLYLFDKARSKWDQGEYEEAARDFAAIHEIYPSSKLAEEALFWSATLYQHYLNDRPRAERYYQQLLVTHPGGHFRLHTMENLAELYAQDKNTLNRTVLLYRKLLKESELSTNWDMYQFQIARSYLLMGKTGQARFEFWELINQYPGSSFQPEAYYLVAYSYFLEKQPKLSQVALRQISKEYPDSPADIRGRFFLGEIYEEQGALRAALQVYEGLRGHAENPAILENRINTIRDRLNRGVR